MWVKIDDDFAFHPKIMGSAPLAVTVQMRALCYTARYQQAGQLPTSFPEMMLSDLPVPDGYSTWTDYMVERHLWDRHGDKIEIHDYLDYNPSKAERDEWSHFLKQRGKRGGAQRAATSNRSEDGTFTSKSPASEPSSQPVGDQQVDQQAIQPKSSLRPDRTRTRTSKETTTSKTPPDPPQAGGISDAKANGHGPALATDIRFDVFWKAYPKKVGKEEARAVWRTGKAKTGVAIPGLDVLLPAIARQKAGRTWIEGYVPNPATWLRHGRWQDEVPEQGIAEPDPYAKFPR